MTNCRKCGEKKLEYAFGHCKECAIGDATSQPTFYCHDHKRPVTEGEAGNCAQQGHILGEIK